MEGRPVVGIIIVAEGKGWASRQAKGKNFIVSTITGRPNGVIAIYIQIGRIEALAGSYGDQCAGRKVINKDIISKPTIGNRPDGLIALQAQAALIARAVGKVLLALGADGIQKDIHIRALVGAFPYHPVAEDGGAAGAGGVVVGDIYFCLADQVIQIYLIVSILVAAPNDVVAEYGGRLVDIRSVLRNLSLDLRQTVVVPNLIISAFITPPDNAIAIHIGELVIGSIIRHIGGGSGCQVISVNIAVAVLITHPYHLVALYLQAAVGFYIGSQFLRLFTVGDEGFGTGAQLVGIGRAAKGWGRGCRDYKHWIIIRQIVHY